MPNFLQTLLKTHTELPHNKTTNKNATNSPLPHLRRSSSKRLPKDSLLRLLQNHPSPLRQRQIHSSSYLFHAYQRHRCRSHILEAAVAEQAKAEVERVQVKEERSPEEVKASKGHRCADQEILEEIGKRKEERREFIRGT